VAVAVIVEHGLHGGSAAAPIAGRILRRYFEEKGVIRKPAVSSGTSSADSPETPDSVTAPPEAEQTEQTEGLTND